MTVPLDAAAYVPKSYVIDSTKERLSSLCAELAPYGPVPFALIPSCAVTVRSAAEERSLLETLAGLQGVTYHEAGVHRALADFSKRRMP